MFRIAKDKRTQGWALYVSAFNEHALDFCKKLPPDLYVKWPEGGVQNRNLGTVFCSFCHQSAAEVVDINVSFKSIFLCSACQRKALFANKHQGVSIPLNQKSFVFKSNAA